MVRRFTSLGLVLAAIGAVFVVMGFFGLRQVEAGQRSLVAFSKAQDVNLTYDDNGNLVDRGTTDGADAIKELLTEDWKYAAKKSELDPNDPLVDTATEYMYQMATIAYHTLNGTQTVMLDKDVESGGQTYKAGTYEFDVDGRYWTDFDRQDPIQAKAREQAWGTANSLIANLGVGAVTASTLQLGTAVSLMILAVGAAFLVLGGGLIWALRGQAPEVTFGA